MSGILKKIKSPADVKGLSMVELERLAEEIREAQEHAAGVSSVLDHITLEEAAAFQKQRSVRGG